MTRLALYSDALAVGGAEIAAGNLLAELDDAIEVTVIGVEPAVADAIASRRPGSAVRTVARVRDKRDLRAIRAHLGVLRSLRPDVLQVNRQNSWAGHYALLAEITTSIPVIAVEHAIFPSTSALQRRLRRVLFSRVTAHVAVGRRAAREAEAEIGVPPGSIEVIHNGVPDVPLDPVARAGPGPVVGWCGRFSPAKGVDVLLRALPAVAEVSCVLVGDGPQRPDLERLAGELGVADRVVMAGWSDRPRNYLPSFDLAIFPSRAEGLPLAVIEAMLAERPVIASDVGGVSELVLDGVTGVLVPPEDPDALGRAIARLLGEPAVAAEMGKRARERALEHFSAAAMARSYEALYRRLLS